MVNGLQDCSSNYFGSLFTYNRSVFGRIFHTRQPRYWQALYSYFCRWPVPWSALENIIVVGSHYLLRRIGYGIFSPHGLPSLHGRVGYSTAVYCSALAYLTDVFSLILLDSSCRKRVYGWLRYIQTWASDCIQFYRNFYQSQHTIQQSHGLTGTNSDKTISVKPKINLWKKNDTPTLVQP